MYRFKYVIDYTQDDTYEARVSKGYIIAGDYNDAIDQLKEYYGHKALDAVYLEIETDTGVMECEDIKYKEVEGTNYKDWEGPLPKKDWF